MLGVLSSRPPLASPRCAAPCPAGSGADTTAIMPAVSKGDGMRGLAVFISDIRNCKSKEAEIKRINKELANIRSKFKGRWGSCL